MKNRLKINIPLRVVNNTKIEVKDIITIAPIRSAFTDPSPSDIIWEESLASISTR